jgi:class 3 adenylate cyclase
MNALVVAILLVVLVPTAFAGGYLTAQRRSAGSRQLDATPPKAEPVPAATPSSFASLVRRTGAELTQIAVQTGVEIGNRAIRDSLGALSAWAQRERPDLHRVTGEDGTVTLMFTDIEDSTALNERLGDDAWLEVLVTHGKLIRRCVRADHGQVIKTLGDSFMVAFARPSNAVSCAIAIQRDLVALDIPGHPTFRVRIGLHTGAAIARGRDLFGVNVATAARVAAQAEGGEILVTDEVAAGLPGDVELGRPRELTLKGLSGAQRVRSVGWAP